MMVLIEKNKKNRNKKKCCLGLGAHKKVVSIEFEHLHNMPTVPERESMNQNFVRFVGRRDWGAFWQLKNGIGAWWGVHFVTWSLVNCSRVGILLPHQKCLVCRRYFSAVHAKSTYDSMFNFLGKLINED